MSDKKAALQLNPMEVTCAELRNGTLTHNNPQHVLKQLTVEGRKRIDAFVFELFFKQRLKRICASIPNLELSFGWHIGYNKWGDGTYWFRLMDSSGEWNACDDAMVSKLTELRVGPKSRPVHVFKVIYSIERNMLLGSQWNDRAWTNWRELEAAIKGLPARDEPREPRPMKNVTPTRSEPAFEKLLNNAGLRSELTSLSVQRRFMNCALSPLLGRDGTDLDAIVHTPDGQLRYLEFKRKFPASGENKYFGIDVWPHHKTIQAMAAMQVSCIHVILVSPKWQKHVSPVIWLNDPKLDNHWTWVAASLDGEAFDDPHLHTSGEDSGQREMERDQKAIKWERIQLLHEGLKLGEHGERKLAEFLLSGAISDAALIDYETLRARQAGLRRSDAVGRDQ